MSKYENPISPSSLNTFLECPYRFKLRYINGIKIGAGEAAQFGSSIHKVNEMFWSEYKQIKNPDVALQNTIDLYWDKTISEEYFQASHSCFNNFLSNIKSTPNLIPLYTEFKALNVVNNTIAIIDVVYPHKIVDYKTSKYFTVKAKLPNIIQAVMCCDNLNQCTGMEIKTVEFHYIRMNKIQYVNITPDLSTDVHNLIVNMRDGIKKDNFPKNLKSCYFCDYKLICNKEKQFIDKYLGKSSSLIGKGISFGEVFQCEKIM